MVRRKIAVPEINRAVILPEILFNFLFISKNIVDEVIKIYVIISVNYFSNINYFGRLPIFLPILPFMLTRLPYYFPPLYTLQK